MAYLKEGVTPPKKGKGSRLRGKMLTFVEEYMADPDLNASRAVLKAGYSTNTRNSSRIAVQLMAHPLVQQEIKERLQERRERTGLTTDYVLAKLIKIVEDTENGNPQAALRGLELLGKHLGMYKERQEISGPDGGAIEMEQKVKEDVADFTSKLSRLAATGGTEPVVEFPKRAGDGST